MSPFTRNVANLRSQDRPVTRYHDAINALFKKIDTLGYSTTALRAMKFFSIAGAVAFGATLLTFGTKFFTSAEKSDA